MSVDGFDEFGTFGECDKFSKILSNYQMNAIYGIREK